MKKHHWLILIRLAHLSFTFATKLALIVRILEHKDEALKAVCAEAMDILERHSAQNFVVMEVENGETGQRYTLTVQRAGRLNPATKWQMAMDRIAMLEQELQTELSARDRLECGYE